VVELLAPHQAGDPGARYRRLVLGRTRRHQLSEVLVGFGAPRRDHLFEVADRDALGEAQLDLDGLARSHLQDVV
jgi:hypothetical protein